MSHTVVRGKPTAAHLYLDTVLDSILVEKGVKPDPTHRDNVTISEIMFHCLKERPKDVFMVSYKISFIQLRDPERLCFKNKAEEFVWSQ